MSTVIIRLLSLNAENVIPEIIWAMIGIYILAVMVCITSVWAVNRNWGWRVFWMLIVAGVPFAGPALHCLRCLMLADLSALKQFGFFSRKAA